MSKSRHKFHFSQIKIHRRGPHKSQQTFSNLKMLYIILLKGKLSNIHLYYAKMNRNYPVNHTNKTCFSRIKLISVLKSAQQSDTFTKRKYICITHMWRAVASTSTKGTPNFKMENHPKRCRNKTRGLFGYHNCHKCGAPQFLWWDMVTWAGTVLVLGKKMSH